ncbi:MAG TPA: hypothetical protein VNW68_06145 [Candidatus Limnocylindria bacterium]|jgi:hypothetical protein|nr:hypothetical protein [Candidatus Limnocylindria bacterium]
MIATVFLGPDGTVVPATEPAAEVLGSVDVDPRRVQLRSSSQVDGDGSAWSHLASKGEGIGEATLIDEGREVHVGVLVRRDSAGWRFEIWLLDRPAEESGVIRDIGELLAEWRAAERELAASPNRERELTARIDRLREQHDRLSSSRQAIAGFR